MVDMNSIEYTVEQLNERQAQIKFYLTAMITGYMASHYPNQYYETDFFDSDSGDDDWQAAYAAIINTGRFKNEDDAYALCDAGTGTTYGQALFMFDQLVDELKARDKIREERRKHDNEDEAR